MIHDLNFRRAGWIGLVVLTSVTGCTHNYYYGALPAGCPPVGTTVTSQVGPVCEVPAGTAVGVVEPPAPIVSGQPSTIVSSSVGSTPSVSGTVPRVVISQPGYGTNRRTPKGFGWHKLDPETSVATTRIQGAMDDNATIR